MPQLDGKEQADPQEVWRIFARHYYLFRGTPTRLWLDYTLENQFGLKERLSGDNADELLRGDREGARGHRSSDHVRFLSNSGSRCWRRQIRRWTRLSIIRRSRTRGWQGRVLPTFRPDAVIDAEYAAFRQNIEKLEEVSGERCRDVQGLFEGPAQPAGVSSSRWELRRPTTGI